MLFHLTLLKQLWDPFLIIFFLSFCLLFLFFFNYGKTKVVGKGGRASLVGVAGEIEGGVVVVFD